MNMKDRRHLFGDESHILEAIAKQYGEGLKEYGASKHAAIAQLYVLAEDHAKFKELCRQI